MLISTTLPISVANAAFLEDYSDMPTKKSLNIILDSCKSNANGNIAELVNTSKISDFYAEYTCEDKVWLDGNQSNTTKITILH